MIKEKEGAYLENIGSVKTQIVSFTTLLGSMIASPEVVLRSAYYAVIGNMLVAQNVLLTQLRNQNNRRL